MEGKWRCDICQKRRFDSLEEATIHEATCQVHPLFRAPGVVAKNKNQKQQRIGTKVATTTSTKNNDKNADDPPVKKHQKTASSAARPKASSTNSTKPIHPFFTKASSTKKLGTSTLNVENVDEATRWDQQRALEYYSKKRNASSQITKPSRDAVSADDDGSSWSRKQHERTTTTTHKKKRPQRPKGILAPRFPIPNHLVPTMIEPQHVDDCALSITTLSLPTRLPTNFASSVSKENDVQVWLTDLPDSPMFERDVLLARAIAECMTPLSASSVSSSSTSSPRRDWVERYYNQGVDNIVPSSVQEALKSFIERFKIERRQANARTKERHDRKKGLRQQLKTIKKRKAAAYDSDDDDGWFDDDDDDDDSKTTTLCLITGPTGSGKSSLVYRVAAQLECQSVLELHPGELRSGAQVRKLLEEATQSHSTKDMIQERIAANAFAKRKEEQQQHQTLVDTSSDDDSTAVEENATSTTRYSNKKGAAVTIILLDEVDTVFESDAGFWPALSELAKTSKCPIILTANRIPNDLKSPYTHIGLDRPTVAECVTKLTTIAEMEGFECHGDNMEKLAIVGECDMRRILYAMQLFSLAPGPPSSVSDIRGGGEDELSIRGGRTMYIDDTAPIVERIAPSSILADEITCLTIHGKNFAVLAAAPCSKSLEVIIGDQVCLFARVLNDETILAMCQPRLLPRWIDCQGYYRGTRRRSLTTSYQSVTVRSASRIGVSNSCATVLALTLADETRLLSHPRPICVDVQFHGFTKETSVPDDEEEDELHVDAIYLAAAPTTVMSEDVVPKDLLDKSLSVFNEALAKWQSSEEATMVSSIDPPTSTHELAIMDDVSLDCQLASDAALLQDAGLCSTPFLSGSCRGFGFTMTPEYPRRTNENSKPYVRSKIIAVLFVYLTRWVVSIRYLFHRPGYQRLFEEGWNEDFFFFGAVDTYVQAPSRNSHERRLLIRTEQAARAVSLGAKVADVPEDEEFREHVYDEEDMFLPNNVAGAILSLPSSLRSGCKTWKGPSMSRCRIVDHRRAKMQSESLDFFTTMMYAGDTKLRFRFDSLDRCGGDVIGATNLVRHGVYFLDYLSIVRCCIVSDRAAKADDPVECSGRRTTRRSGRQRQAFLERLVPPFARQGDDLAHFNEMSLTLYENALHLSRPPLPV
jgi:DNA polymerase III delta prime subunit